MYHQKNPTSISILPSSTTSSHQKTRTPQNSLPINQRLVDKYSSSKKPSSEKFIGTRERMPGSNGAGSVKRGQKNRLLKEKIKSEKGQRRRSTFKRKGDGKYNQENLKDNGQNSYQKGGLLLQKTKSNCY